MGKPARGDPAAAGGQRFCTSCGTAIAPDARFCRSCGAPIGALAAQQIVSSGRWPVALAAGAIIVALVAFAMVKRGGGDDTPVGPPSGGSDEQVSGVEAPGGLAELDGQGAAVTITHSVDLPTGPDAQFDGANTVGVVDGQTLLALGVAGGGDVAHSQMWRSTDGGTVWTNATGPAEGFATAVAGTETGAVAVGYEIYYDGEIGRAARPLAWTSDDAGTTWSVHEISGTNLTFRPSGIAVGGDGTLIAAGEDGPELRDEGPGDPVIVVSRDGGESWDSVSLSADSLAYDGVSSVAYGNGRFVAIGYIDDRFGEYEYRRETVVWTSEDGERWERSAGPDLGLEYSREAGLVSLGDGVAALFSREEVALSEDGLTWRRVPLQGLEFGVDSLGEYGDIPYGGVLVDDRLVLVGDESYEDGSSPRAWVARLGT